jgi:flagellar hook-associated protein 1 FlgK
MSTALLSIGVGALKAAYAQMQTTGHNIANANVQGYSRQNTLLATAVGQQTITGYFGRGVDVTGVQRVSDAFKTREAANARALAAMDQALNTRLGQMESAFQTGERGIGYAVSQLFSALSDLANNPSDSATRSVVLARAMDMAKRFNASHQQLTGLQEDVNQELSSSVATVNGIAANVAKVNSQIVAARSSGQSPNDLLDERDRLISQLSQYVQVTTIEAEDGSWGVFVGGGQRLVLGAAAEKLQVVPDAYDGSRSAIAITEGASLRTLGADALGGGSLKGLLDFQNDGLVAARAQLGQLALAVADALNRQQQLGLNLQPPAGSVASQAMFGFAAGTQALALPAHTNQKDASGNYIGQVSLQIVDASQLQATEYELRADPANAGQWLLARVPADGTPARSVADGDQVDGFILHFDTAPQAGDRFRLAPVTGAAGGMQALLSDPLDVAAASAFTAATPGANAGTASVTALRVTSAPPYPNGTATVAFTGADAAGNMSYDWQIVDAGNNVLASGSGTWTPGQTMPRAGDPSINGIEFDVSGVPQVGDTIVLAPTTDVTTNNGNALALHRLDTLNLVGLTRLADGSLSGGLSFEADYAALLADVGVRVQSAGAAADISTARADQAENERSSVAGVNLDEEAARLIQYQQAYQAAAKVLKIAQDVFDALLSIAG